MAKLKLIRTKMMTRYSISFLVRLTIFIVVFVMYLTKREVLIEAVTHEISVGADLFGVTVLHLVWAYFMIMMLRHIFQIKLCLWHFEKMKKKII